MSVYDLLIKNGMIVDGAGNPWYSGDVAVAGGKIAKIGRGLEAPAKVVIDASGKIVSPGFIDAHTHSDFPLLADPMAQSKIQQGVTTEVVGLCGGWAAPIMGQARESVEQQVARYGNVTVDWTSMAEYLGKLDKQGVSVNVIPLVGFGSVRACVAGYTENPATMEQRKAMRALVEQAVEEGAFGMSTGLFYAPQIFAPTDEVIDVARGLTKTQSLYVTHPRDESDYTIGYAAAIKEGIQIGEAANVPVTISHLHALGVATWKRAPEYVKIIEDARARGVDVTGDQYPYAASGGGITGSVMPRWSLDGGRAKMLERLRDKALRDQIASEVAVNFKRRGGAYRHTFSVFKPRPEFEGMSLDKVAEILGEAPEYAVLTMLEMGDASWVSQIIDEEDIATFFTQPWVMGGSDGSALAPSGPVNGGMPHPRNFGTFPRWVGTYARDKQLMPVHEVVRKLTSLPAARFNLSDRGLLKEGFWADILVFDWNTISDRATFAKPHQFPVGIDYVIVNGEITVDHQNHTGKLAGKALRRDS